MHKTIVFLAIQLTVATTCSAQNASPSKHRIFAGTGEQVLNTAVYPPGAPAGPAVKLAIGNPFGIEFSENSVWITSVDDHCIYRGKPDGKKFQRVVGNGLIGYTGDGGRAEEATFNWPHEVRADAAGKSLHCRHKKSRD